MEGLTIHKKFITKSEQKELVDEIYSKDWSKEISRRTQHYGFRYPYYNLNTSSLIRTDPLLDSWDWIIERMIDHEYISSHPDQMIINEYNPGQGIAYHTDHKRHFKSPIISLSLMSPIIFNFSKGEEDVEIDLKPRTLLIMGGEARWDWKHGIEKKKIDMEIVN